MPQRRFRAIRTGPATAIRMPGRELRFTGRRSPVGRVGRKCGASFAVAGRSLFHANAAVAISGNVRTRPSAWVTNLTVCSKLLRGHYNFSAARSLADFRYKARRRQAHETAMQVDRNVTLHRPVPSGGEQSVPWAVAQPIRAFTAHPSKGGGARNAARPGQRREEAKLAVGCPTRRLGCAHPAAWITNRVL
jgi:hypothetical protein